MIRGVGLRGAVAVNIITMIGIGPLITIPLVVGKLHGSAALLGWIAGAVVALCDGLVWAELSSRFPGSGGTYVYLREAFGRDRWGRMFAFLFNWQFIFYAPLLLASGYIGFASYASYLWPPLASSPLLGALVRVALGALTMVLLYRRITSIAKMSMVLCVTAVATLCIVIAASLPHANIAQAFSTDMHPNFSLAFLLAVGSSLYLTLYDYVGYADAALIGEEVRNPNRTIPLSIVLSVLIVAALYVLMQFGVLSVVPWQKMLALDSSAAQYIGTTVVGQTWGGAAAIVFTVLVLITAFASLYGNLLGFARVPFAAARDGVFFPVFRHLNARGQFPDVALLVIGIASIGASFFTLDTVIAYLTAAVVLVQAVAQIAAVFVLRVKHESPPFRMWLFPLPALVALAGWGFAYYSTGALAIALSLAAVAAGLVLFLFLARFQRTWPFALLLVFAAVASVTHPAQARYGHSAVVQQHGYPVFTVNGKPFFVYGAAFFYERMPKSSWRHALRSYKALGINTIDLYVIWNWHELSDGDFDFTGRTNPRRDLRGLLAIIHQLGFKAIVRPGPVIRNEWKNGGYPAWLLERADYSMSPHDVLEGRYPATATLQNAHSDDAAAEWLHNPTHMRYSTRWLQRVFREIAPWSDDVIAIALDDDQGAYIDNQTWPAPNFHAYISALNSVVRAAAPGVPTFINTYQMKVTASAPVWAWGNWYQSDAYSIGEHDRAQLEFSTGLLQTQPAFPVMVSEFQAGWLQGPDENAPRAADPSNTELASGTMLQMGAHGIVNFPVQDTFAPPGYEAPFANAFYGWDAAYGYSGAAQPRWTATARIGALLKTYGSAIAQSHRAAFTAIEWPVSAGGPSIDVYKTAASAIALQQGCRQGGVPCDFIDATFATPAQRARYRSILKLDAAPAPRSAAPPDLVRLAANDGTYALDVVTNYATVPETIEGVRVAARTVVVIPHGRFASPAAHARAHPREPLPASQTVAAAAHKTPAGITAGDLFASGFEDVALQSAFVRVIVSPHAGARAFVFEDLKTHRNIFSSAGALRDDVANPIPPSPRDYIAKYTHQLAAGTFNRDYENRVTGDEAAFLYEMPDAQAPITFEKTLTLLPDGRSFAVRYTDAVRHDGAQAVSTSALTTGNLLTDPTSVAFIAGTAISPIAPDAQYQIKGEPAVALYDPKSKELAVIWSDAELHGIATVKRGNLIVALRYPAAQPVTFRFGYYAAASLQDAVTKMAALTGRRL